MIEEILQKIARHERVHLRLSHGGTLSLDRGLPFLIVHRAPPGRADEGTARLVSAEAAYLVAEREEAFEAAELVRSLARAGSEAYGAFLVLELWSSPDAAGRRFTIYAPDGPAPEAAARLVEELQPLRKLAGGLDVALEAGERRAPPDLEPLLSVEESWQGEVLLLGLELPPVYRDPETGEVYPRFLRVLQRGLSRALRRAIYEFVRVQTSSRVENHLALGTRSLPDQVWEVDSALLAVERTFDLLLLTSPVNLDEAWRTFRDGGFERKPVFHYRLLPLDPDLLKRTLFDIPVERVDDPALTDLFDGKRQELDTLLTMLRERNTANFRYGSQRLYGTVDPDLRRLAEELLATVRIPRRRAVETVDAAGFYEAAVRELDHYRQRYPALDRHVQIRRDLVGLMVSSGNLLIGEDLQLDPARVAPLLQHEVGTHVLTYVNGSAQPLNLLSLGLAGYDELQEGLAVLAEYLVGGLTHLRMRLLAARVVAAHAVERGADFVETFRLLTEDHGYSAPGAWHIAVRVHACGGFTRDFIYLRGLVKLMELLRNGGELEPLYLGKMAQRHIPVLEELRHRGVLRKPPLTPRFLEDPAARDRLDAVRGGLQLTEMLSPGGGMKIGFLVNDVDTEHPRAATTVIARAAAAMGHTVYMLGVGELTYASQGGIRMVGRLAPEGSGLEQAEWLARVQSEEAERVPITASDLDVLYLRYNPSENPVARPWEADAGIVFGQAAVLEGVLVLSHPFSLSYAVSKMYLEYFPQEVRPRSIITRSYEEVARFHERENGRIVLKPLDGYGGQDVYLVKEGAENLRQIVDSLGRSGYVIAQEYLPAATDGDTRLFLFNGKPLVHEGKYAAVRRVNETGDFRSNLSLGARPHRAEITPRMLEIAEMVRPRLLADGIFDAGLDIVGDKLVEINTISSGGLNAASKLEGVDFGQAVVRLIERKVAHRQREGHRLENRALAVMD